MTKPSDFPTNQCLWHSHLRCIYAVVPKVATSSIMQWFIDTSPQLKNSWKGRDPHDLIRSENCMDHLPSEEVKSLVQDPAVFKFTFVRNPWTRLVSGYLDKVISAKPQGKALIRKAAKSSLQGWLKWKLYRHTVGVKRIYQRALTFREFVQRLAAEKPDEINWHFRPQSLILANIPVDFVGRLEHFEADFGYVLSRVGETIPVPKKHNKQYQPMSVGDCVADWPAAELRAQKQFPHWRRFYSPDLEEQVAEMFAGDFERFGYSNKLTPNYSTKVYEGTAVKAFELRRAA